MGPYEIDQVFENRSVKLTNIDEEDKTFIVNGHRLKIYHKPINKEDFIQTIYQQKEVEIA